MAASPLVQKARQQKMIYFAAIVALFTLSLILREFVIKPQATRLQLRETARGEVELTSSAVRLMLTGSRGLAVTILWYNAQEMQKRGEWNELELIVKSITKLQPYFITPWLFQSWNISFNVSVECDRPRDKYYYISRGLELLAEGERRNSGTADRTAAADPARIDIPGNPDLRQFMGFVYQLKIGTSDEQKTMRSFLEMSCIDPIERDPARFLGEKGQVNGEALARFCAKYPRLVRRLNEQLEYDNPRRIVQFLADNQNIPGRFKPIDKSQKTTMTASDLKDPIEQFPILPPKEKNWPDPNTRDLTTTEAIDVFLISRTWYEFAQKPLPEPEQDPVALPRDYDKLKHRVPKSIVIQLFRQYPARAQVFIAEALEQEGFFDEDGWDAAELFKAVYGRKVSKADFTFGSASMYHSRVAWQRGYQAYKKYGEENGMYVAPADMRELNKKAELIRKEAKIKPGQLPELRPEWREGPLRESYDAALKIFYHEYYRNLSNYDSYLHQSEGEADEVTMTMRKTLYKADRQRRQVATSATLALYNEAWNLYLLACLKNPRFAQVGSMQEDFYEHYQRSLGITHTLNQAKFREPALLAAKIAYWPTPTWQQSAIQFMLVSEKERDQQEMAKIFPWRKRSGPLDMVQYYHSDESKELKQWLCGWLHGASASAGNPSLVDLFAGREHLYLTADVPLESQASPPSRAWVPLISPYARESTRDRLGLNR